MKQFDLEAAKAGAAVCTQNGQAVKILCFDRRNDEYPLVTLVGDKELVQCYTLRGKLFYASVGDCSDLFMTPVKREGWFNIYPYPFAADGRGKVANSGDVYDTERIAKDRATTEVMATVKVEWEE